jgi:hypothetical protein
MKFSSTIILIIAFFFAEFSFGQNLKEASGQRRENYFSFRIHSKEEIETLTKMISIDDVRGDSVWAYANIQQFIKFTQLGYSITLLPSPGDVPNVIMKDHITPGSKTPMNYYPTYTAYEDLMNNFQALYPSICQLQTIATLASGRKIIIAKISDNVATDEAEPEFLYTSTIHGDETTGYILMLDLIDYLLSNYGTNTEVTDLVNSMEIYINPLANPDGTYAGGNSTVSGATRGNANGVDMNRNYPDPQAGQHPDGYAWQPETVAFMDFATQHHIVASANFHGGVEVVNYPWDTWYALHADDNWWQYVSREYADNVHLYSPSTYMDYLNNGITNGAAWYLITGGRQDYMNYYQHCHEVTIELSDTKLLPAAQLQTLWNYNWHSLILYMKEALYGIHGIITDQVTGNPVAAKVFINGHDNNGSESYSSANPGDYSRQIKAGTYTLEVSATNYTTKTITGVVVTDHATTNLNIQLVPNIVITTAAKAITQNTAISGGTVVSDGGSPIISRGVCWGTIANPNTSGSHTTDGSGIGAFTSSVTGLSSSTLYHVRAYAINSNGTYYGSDLLFSTLCGVISAFPWNEGFENAGTIPNCWTNERVNSSGIDWSFITGNGTGNPAAAHSGTYNACLKDNSSADNKTRLISPSINLTSIISPQLKFWHTQALWSPDQDVLTVYYRTSLVGTWTQLATYASNITVWTLETINLPNATSDYYINFEGNAKYGYGVCVDDVSIIGTAKTLTIAPSNQNVTLTAGNTAFSVTSNTSWLVASNQPWCTVTASGSGNGAITATYSQNTSATPRVAEITVTVVGLTPIFVTVTQDGATEKVLNLTVFLEGLFNGTSMIKARNASGEQFPGTVADQITLELHNSTSPYALAGGPYTVNVNTDGSASFTVPASLGSSYYIVVKHRNSMETWSGTPLSFGGATLNYNFSNSAAQAFGNNLKLVSGKYVIFGGDVNQDGLIDSGDMVPTDNDASNFANGYIVTDLNGDGLVNSADIAVVESNVSGFATIIRP